MSFNKRWAEELIFVWYSKVDNECKMMIEYWVWYTLLNKHNATSHYHFQCSNIREYCTFEQTTTHPLVSIKIVLQAMESLISKIL